MTTLTCPLCDQPLKITGHGRAIDDIRCTTKGCCYVHTDGPRCSRGCPVELIDNGTTLTCPRCGESRPKPQTA